VETTFTDDRLAPETTYTYTVEAQSAQGALSVPSAPIEAMAKPSRNGPSLEIVSAQIDDVFSAHYKYYSQAPVGRVVIRNNGPAPFTKIKVAFSIQGYMDFPTEIQLADLHSHEEKEVPLLATFNNKILDVTETTPIQAEVRLSFYQGTQEYPVTRTLPFKLYSRNTIRWDHTGQFASFVTPNDPVVLDFARSVALPFQDPHRDAPLPDSLKTAWALFNGLGAYGITYVPRPNNPYDKVSLDSTTVDTLQFARETLARKSGDCADVVALLSSSLESLGVATAALETPGHLFLMLDTGESDLAELGLPPSWLVPYAGTYWVPLEATMLGSPFMEAWRQGADEYRRYSSQGQARVLDIHHVWGTFEPATLKEIASSLKAPSPALIEEKFPKDWKELLDLHWQAVQAQTQEALDKNPSAGEPWLTRGILAAQYKRWGEAKDDLTKARQDTATAAAAANDLGNLAYLQNQWAEAAADYQEAARLDPQDAGILINLARAYLKQKDRQKASSTFDTALQLDPTLKSQYADVNSLAP
jgi:tetratricopeptide (TPR) repeat protein